MAFSFRGRIVVILSLIALAAAVAIAWKTLPWGSQAEPGTSTRASASNSIDSNSDTDDTATFHFDDVTDELGVQFIQESGFPSFFLPEVMGTGVALFDFDQDGRLDILFRNGTPGPPHPLGTADTPHTFGRLYHQLPNGKFEDVTEKSGLMIADYGTGVAIGDVNNDGFPDVYVVNFGTDRLFLNRGNGTFLDISVTAGISDSVWGASAAFVDFDRDGLLDLFVANYVNYSNPKTCEMANGRRDYCHPKFFPPTVAKLYRNVTNASDARDNPAAVRFEDVSESSGIASKAGPGLGVRPIDFDDDGWPDIYVANDSAANFLWMNQRNGTFRELALPLGAAYDTLGRPQASMGIAEGDTDGDGQMDLLITNYRGEGSTLYRKQPIAFEDATSAAGILAPSFPHTGFGIALADFDHDGSLDVAVANGSVVQREDRPPVLLPNPRERNAAAVAQFWKAYAEPNQFLMNDGHGKYRDVSKQAGDFTAVEGVARALAVGDLDNDGALDIVVTYVAAPAKVYRNKLVKRGHWLMLRVIEPQLGGRDAYGAVVTVVANDKSWMRRVQPASSYLCSDDPRIHFGLGDMDHYDRIVVRWADGTHEEFPGAGVDTMRTVAHGEGQAR